MTTDRQKFESQLQADYKKYVLEHLKSFIGDVLAKSYEEWLTEVLYLAITDLNPMANKVGEIQAAEDELERLYKIYRDLCKANNKRDIESYEDWLVSYMYVNNVHEQAQLEIASKRIAELEKEVKSYQSWCQKVVESIGHENPLVMAGKDNRYIIEHYISSLESYLHSKQAQPDSSD